MNETIKLISDDREELNAYVSYPSGESRGAVVVLQEILGVNRHIRSVADRLALAGYIAIAPGLFDRYQPGFEAGYEQEDIQRGMEIMKQFKRESALNDIQAAVAFARDRYRTAVGVVGFCLGGSLAWMAAAKLDVSVAVGYYGGYILQMDDLEPQSPVMLHFGKEDLHIPISDVEAFTATHPEAEVYTYDAGHGFNCDERSDFVGAAANQAWARTLAFLTQHLG